MTYPHRLACIEEVAPACPLTQYNSQNISVKVLFDASLSFIFVLYPLILSLLHEPVRRNKMCFKASEDPISAAFA